MSSRQQGESSSQVPTFRVEVTVERAVDLPRVGLRKHAPDTYVKIKVGEDSECTRTVERNLCPEWNKSFIFNCSPSATIMLIVYAKRTARKDKALGHISAPIAFFSSTSPTGNERYEQAITSDSVARLVYKILVRRESANSEESKPLEPTDRNDVVTASEHIAEFQAASGSTAGADHDTEDFAASAPEAIKDIAYPSAHIPASETDGPKVPDRVGGGDATPSTLVKVHDSVVVPHPIPKLRSTVEVEDGFQNDVLIADTVSDTTRTLHHMSSPGAIAKLPGIVDDGKAIFDHMESIQDTLSPLPSLMSFLDKLQAFCTIMDDISTVHPYASMAWKILSSAYTVVQNQLERDTKVRGLFQSLTSLYNIVKELEKMEGGKIRAMAESQNNLLPQITFHTLNCCYFVRDYASRGFMKRLVKGAISPADKRIADYCDVFTSLEKAFYNSLNVSEHLMASQTLDELESLGIKMDLSLGALRYLDMKIDFNDMPYASGASLEPSKACLPGTRTESLDEIIDWINSDEDGVPRIMLLTGASGSGKSTIASSIAGRFRAIGRLGASFAFSRNRPDRTPDKLFPTIARSLAELDPGIYQALCERIGGDTALRTTTDLALQFDSFLAGPVAKLNFAGPVVVVIDALDESGNVAARKPLLSILSKRLKDLSPQLRILITSRPEEDVNRVLAGHDGIALKSMSDIPPASTHRDIALYIRTQLTSDEAPSLDGLNIEEASHRLALISQGLFQWAAVACAAIVGMGEPGFSPRERYQQLINSGSTANKDGLLDSLYMQVLSQLFDPQKSPDSVSRFKTIMSFVLASFEPLSIKDIDLFRKASTVKGSATYGATHTLQFLGSLLSGTSFLDRPVLPLHSSFSDFLTDEIRSKDFFIDVSGVHIELAYASLKIMQAELKFNICQLGSSYDANRDIANLTQLISQYVSPHLSYACRYWADHLGLSPFSTLDHRIYKSLKIFLSERLLFWLEVLSLLKAALSASGAISVVNRFASVDSELRDLVGDVLHFLAVFGPVISASAPHIYLSALPFSTPNSLVSQHFLSAFPNTLKVCNASAHWPTTQRILQHSTLVTSVAVSPDGQYIVSGCADDTPKLWSALTGTLIHDFSRAHGRWIGSIAFSANSALLATASDDRTVQIWDAANGDPIGEPLTGHTGEILSVSFSSRGPQIISISKDGSVCTWDSSAISQTRSFEPAAVSSRSFKHNRIRCATSSSDGTHFATGGGSDGIVMLWTVDGEECQSEELLGHSAGVMCLVFSADDRYLASGSNDCTVRIWDIQSLEEVGGPLEGHEGRVRSAAFSPRDPTCVASGSEDATIRIWSIATAGNVLVHILRGHIYPISSLSYTVDGTYLVSGSDLTIRIWSLDGLGADDVEHEALAEEEKYPPLYEFQKRSDVMAVCFSPDSTAVVSGSQDGVLRAWDAATGRVLCKPFAGHTDSIGCLAFSRDGSQIVSACDEKRIRIWDAKTYEPIGEPLVGHSDLIREIGFTKDDKQIVSVGNDAVRLWDRYTGALADKQLDDQLPPAKRFEGRLGAISADGSLVAYHASDGGQDNHLRVWDVDRRRVILKRQYHFPFFPMVLLPDNTTLLVGQDGSTLTKVNVRTGDSSQWKTISDEFIHCLTSSATGNYIAAGTDKGLVHVWHLETGAFVARLSSQPQQFRPLGPPVTAFAFSPDGRYIAKGAYQGALRIWSMEIESQNEIDDREVITFSIQRQHALPKPETLFHSFLSFPSDNRRHTITLDNEGWVKATVGKETRLLFWVPVHYRARLALLNTGMLLTGQDAIYLDLHKFVHGLDWSRCMQ